MERRSLLLRAVRGWIRAGLPEDEATLRRFPAMDLESERARLRELIDQLTDERQRLVLRARYLEDPPRVLRDLAAHFGITGERVRQLELRALGKLGIVG